MQLKKGREAVVEIWRQDRQYVIGRLFKLRGNILRLLKFSLTTGGSLPLLSSNQKHFNCKILPDLL
jgi:hypothetical protein